MQDFIISIIAVYFRIISDITLDIKNYRGNYWREYLFLHLKYCKAQP